MNEKMLIYEHNRCEGDCRGCKFRELTPDEIANKFRVTYDDYVERDLFTAQSAQLAEAREIVAVARAASEAHQKCVATIWDEDGDDFNAHHTRRMRLMEDLRKALAAAEAKEEEK